jgi:hypothetical protein
MHEAFEEASESVEREAEAVWNAISENERASDEGEQLIKEREQEAECEAESPEERGKRLKREGEELLGRRHSKAGAERWHEWWNDLNKADRRLYKKFRGPPPRRRS